MLVWVARFLIKDLQAFVFTSVLNDLLIFKITSDYLILCFLRSPSGETATNLEGSIFTTPIILFNSSKMTKNH